MIFMKRLWILLSTLSPLTYYILHLFIITPMDYITFHYQTKYAMLHPIAVWVASLMEAVIIEALVVIALSLIAAGVVTILEFYPKWQVGVMATIREKKEILFPSTK